MTDVRPGRALVVGGVGNVVELGTTFAVHGAFCDCHR